MNNCLVTKLKETVDNDNLLIYGVLKLKVSSNTSENGYFHFYVEDDSEATMTIESDDENDYFMDFKSNKMQKCKYCSRELNKLGNCPKPCKGGALLIRKKELEEKIAKMKGKK